MTEIVCISATGKARAAKDSVAKMLKEELEKEKKRVLVTYYAAPLRRICRDWFGWDGQNDEAGRSLLQYIGTDIVRARQPDFWVDFTLSLLSMLGDEWDYVIIPDIRFPNELDMERYGFHPRHIRVEGSRPEGPLGKATPDFTIMGDMPPGRLRGDVSAVVQNLLYV